MVKAVYTGEDEVAFVAIGGAAGFVDVEKVHGTVDVQGTVGRRFKNPRQTVKTQLSQRGTAPWQT